MKASWTVLLAVGIAASMDAAAAACASACESQLVHFREEACQKWREVLPRPDLFNHCGQGFNQGKSAGCDGFCQEIPDVGIMKSLRLDACSSLKGVPPQERQQACQAGFSAALDLAREVAVYDAAEASASASAPTTDSATASESASGTQASASAQGSQDASAAGRKLEETEANKPRKVNVKKVIPENERRNLLDEARREAEKAFEATADKVEL